MNNSATQLHKTLTELETLLELNAAPADDDLVRRWASLDIRITALEVTEARADLQFRNAVVKLTVEELNREIAQLVMDLLGWYALPDEPEGANEAPVGTDQARRLRSRYLAQLVTDETRRVALKDELAALLARHKTQDPI